MKLLDRRFDRRTGLSKPDLPEGWDVPRVRVVGESSVPGRSTASTRRPRPRLLEVARIILEGSANLRPSPGSPLAHPRFVELDPAYGLSSGAARLDRLTRTILADPRALEPGRLPKIAEKAARLQDPVAPDRIVDEAFDRLSPWVRTPLAREVAGAKEVRRLVPLGDPPADRRRFDRVPGAGRPAVPPEGRRPRAGPLQRPGRLGDSRTPPPAALRRRGRGGRPGAVVDRAWWVRLGPGGGLMGVDRFEDEAIDRAILDVLGL